jgi:hypothetical protein
MFLSLLIISTLLAATQTRTIVIGGYSFVMSLNNTVSFVDLGDKKSLKNPVLNFSRFIFENLTFVIKF